MSEVIDGWLHYTGSGLNNVWLRNGFEEKETPYGKGLVIHHLEELHRAIGLFLANNREELAGEELRFLRKEMDLPQSQLAELLDVTTDTLRGWENGRSAISGPADKLVRFIYMEAVSDQPITRIRERLERIAKLNREVHAERLEFEETAEGWGPAPKVA
jgi:DNA-binding transcriptional regulator YiaG